MLLGRESGSLLNQFHVGRHGRQLYLSRAAARGLPARRLEHLASRIEIEQEYADADDEIGPGRGPETRDDAGAE